MHIYDRVKAASVDNKRPLLLFSGGWDSTMLLDHLLEFTNVDTFFVSANPAPLKKRKEKEARRKILHWFNMHRYQDIGNGVEPANKFFPGEDYSLEIDEVWAKTRNYAMVQPISWLTAALIKFNPDRHSGVAIGYLLGDQAPAFREHLEAFWKSGWALLRGMFTPAPPLWFPLLDRGVTKEVVVRELRPVLTQMVWVCEVPETIGEKRRFIRHDDHADDIALDQIVPCGRCKPCRLLAHTIADWEADNHGDDYWEVRTGTVQRSPQLDLDFYGEEEYVASDGETYPKVKEAEPAEVGS